MATADESSRLDVPSRKKTPYPIGEKLRDYLVHYDRELKLPIQYQDLLRYTFATPLIDKEGKDTLWLSVLYEHNDMQEIYNALTYIYALLHADGRMEVMEHLSVARIDYCTFGNSKPFRIRIINRLNDNYDHFYVKTADASRVYGLELEHILSPNRINYLTYNNTLVEQHIPGLPGDVFVEQHLENTKFNQIRISKEFVKFNERCFLRLLGDMRSYNFVVDITPDIEANQYRIKAIDFDQQSYEGRKNFYLPHFFKENNKLVFLGMQFMDEKTMRQYQQEERSLMAHRIKLSKKRLGNLFAVMKTDQIAPEEKVTQLREDLAEYHQNESFKELTTMGQIVEKHLRVMLEKNG